MSNDQYDEVSDEAKLQIAQHFLLSSPPGQFNEVLADVRKILPDGVLSDPLTAGIARAYNLKNAVIVTTPSGNKAILNSAVEIDSTHYINSIDRKVYGVDHLTHRTVEDSRTISANDTNQYESERQALQYSLQCYIQDHYSTEDVAFSIILKDDKISFTIAGEKINLRNYWSGKLISNWNINFVGNGQISINGEIKIHAHYFEDGNVQLKTLKNVPEAILQFSSSDSLARVVIAHVNSTESSLQSGLEEMFMNMNDETFKSMRRVMPITMTKMDWNINSIRMIQQMQIRK